MKRHFALAIATTAALTACAPAPTESERTAERLDNAAVQSGAAAAASLRKDAEAVRTSGVSVGNASDSDGTVQNAMENAGEAQANTLGR
jgi:hypothetical protein